MRNKLFLIHYENEWGERLTCAMRAPSVAMAERFMAPNEVLNVALLDETDLEGIHGDPVLGSHSPAESDYGDLSDSLEE